MKHKQKFETRHKTVRKTTKIQHKEPNEATQQNRCIQEQVPAGSHSDTNLSTFLHLKQAASRVGCEEGSRLPGEGREATGCPVRRVLRRPGRV